MPINLLAILVAVAACATPAGGPGGSGSILAGNGTQLPQDRLHRQAHRLRAGRARHGDPQAGEEGQANRQVTESADRGQLATENRHGIPRSDGEGPCT